MVEKKGKRDPLEAAEEAHAIFLEPAKFLVSKLGPAKQAGVELDVNRCSSMGSQAELTFGSLFYQLIMSITEEVGSLGLVFDMEKLNRLPLLERAGIFCDESLAQRLLGAGFSRNFVVLIARKLKVVVPEASFQDEGKAGAGAGAGVPGEESARPTSVIGTTYVCISDVFRGLDDARGVAVAGTDGGELVDTRRGGTDRFGEQGKTGETGQAVARGSLPDAMDMGNAPTDVYSVEGVPLDAVLQEGAATDGASDAGGVDGATGESRDKPSRISLPSFLRQIGDSRLIGWLSRVLRGVISRK